MSAAKKSQKRLESLDILRGITIAAMIMVNNPGSWGYMYAPLKHATWNGLTPTDLVFPFFMFIMGFSSYFSMRKYDFRFSWPVAWKILRRSVIIFAIGIFIAWLSRFMRVITGTATLWESIMCFDTIRFLGVMPRLAICYFFGAFIVIFVKPRRLPLLICAMLVIYSILIIFGKGYEFSDNNIIARIDRAVVGVDHMYTETIDGISLKFDPEGLLSTLPSIAHMLIGFMLACYLASTSDNEKRALRMFIAGTILTFTGFLLSYGLPINKKIWSPTFVLTTCGMAASMLGLLIWIADIHGHTRWARFFEVFGINPLAMYTLGSVLSVLSYSIPVGDTSIKGFLYSDILTPLCHGDKTLSSFLFSLIILALVWCVGYILYKKKIYIKI